MKMIRFEYKYHIAGSYIKEEKSLFFDKNITTNFRINRTDGVRRFLEKAFNYEEVIIFNWKLLSFRVRFCG